MERLDRHVLVVVLWLGLGIVAAVLMRLGAERPAYLLAGFGVLIVAFYGHVVVNLATGTAFTTRELALGLVVYAVALAGFSVAALTSDAARAQFVPVGIGFAALFVAVLGHLVTANGLRGTFDAFDRIRRFRPEEPA